MQGYGPRAMHGQTDVSGRRNGKVLRTWISKAVYVVEGSLVRTDSLNTQRDKYKINKELCYIMCSIII